MEKSQPYHIFGYVVVRISQSHLFHFTSLHESQT